ncbi:FAD-dependent oxidoreductase [Rhodococcus koreensis]
MAHVILQSCCNDASCVAVCPVDCIHPTPHEPGFMRAEMLHINPDDCIDCGACIDECPVDAIRPEDELTEDQEEYRALNAEYFDSAAESDGLSEAPKPWRKNDFTGLRVAIVGSGPSAFYTALDLVALKAARVEMFERLLTPYGLVRFGVAPDHQTTKGVTDVFRSLGKKPNFNINLGVTIGEHLTHAELLEHFHAVVYAVGATADRRLGIAGEDLACSHAATKFVSWYNGHPDSRDRTFDLSGEHAVIVGNGNVALDVARVLLSDPEQLAKTDIADHALEALRKSNIRTVTLLGRRGVGQAAYTNPEFLAITSMPGVEVVIDADEVATDEATQQVLDDEDTDAGVRMKVRYAQEIAARGSDPQPKKLILRYLCSPREALGDSKVESLELERNRLELREDGVVAAVATGETETVPCDLLFRSVGYRGTAVPDLPFDDIRGVVTNLGGRVVDGVDRDEVPKVYVTGWIKRGPTGVIGTNKKCALDTVDLLLQDYADGKLEAPAAPADSIQTLVRVRQPDVLRFDDWLQIDKAERQAGKERGSSRVKFVDPDSMMDVLRARAAN